MDRPRLGQYAAILAPTSDAPFSRDDVARYTVDLIGTERQCSATDSKTKLTVVIPTYAEVLRSESRSAAMAHQADRLSSLSNVPANAAWPPAARAVAGLLLVLFVTQAVVAALRDSVTVDEFVGLPTGLYTILHADTSPPTMNPPFFRIYAALPLALSGVHVSFERGMNHWGIGYRFMEALPGGYHALFVVGRCMVVLAAVVLGMLVVSWASCLYGWEAGLVAAFLFAFSPSMLAHGHLVTLDLAGALGFTAATYAAWRLVGDPSLARGFVLGVMLGIAPLLKMSNLTLCVAVPAVVAIGALGKSRRCWRAYLMPLAVAAPTALFVVNCAYGFEGTPVSLAGFDASSEVLRKLAHGVPWLPLPLPEPFVRGIDLVLAGDEVDEPTYFLAGQLSSEGWWYYHLVAFALKTPIPIIFSAIVAIILWIAGHRRGRDESCLFLPIFVVFAANAVLNPLNIGVRHTMPVLPLLFVVGSAVLAAPFRERRPIRAALAGALLLWLAGGTLSVAPRYIQYFNEFAGGPANGHRWLIDSNLDWGQDLVRLAEYLRGHSGEPLHLAYFGRVNPAVYGIRFVPVAPESRGLIVVSATFLMGRPYVIWERPDRLAWAPSGRYTWLQRVTPAARVGSLFVYEVH